jgi:CRP/FNR family transcriptional regulator, cyclic AMP receptor protein
MRKVLYILSEFKDQDIDWITGVGDKQTVREGEFLVHAGELIDTLYIVLNGRLEVSIGGAGAVVAHLGSGEIVGELSFLDSRPPNADVRATEDSIVYAIPSRRLTSKFRTDEGFAARFYRALGLLLSDRLRDTTSQLAYGSEKSLDSEEEEYSEISPDLLDKMGLAGQRFNDILSKLLSKSS